jgi:hypothetical protein
MKIYNEEEHEIIYEIIKEEEDEDMVNYEKFRGLFMKDGESDEEFFYKKEK